MAISGGGRRDPVEVMTEMFDSFKTYADRSQQSETNSVKYRLNLLWIHATAALLIAPLFAAIGQGGMKGPSFEVMRHIPGAPGSVAVIIGLSGFILGLGCVLRAKKMEIAGLVGLTIWYLLIVTTFGGAVLHWFADGSPKDRVPALYSPVLYGHFAVIMIAHMINLIRARRIDERYGEL